MAYYFRIGFKLVGAGTLVAGSPMLALNPCLPH